MEQKWKRNHNKPWFSPKPWIHFPFLFYYLHSD